MPYTAVVLKEESRQELINALTLDKAVPADWVIKAHHMTCDMKSASKSLAAEFIGQEVELEVMALGAMMTEPGVGIFAVQVACSVPSKNAIKHVTLAHHTAIKPVKSNDITTWLPRREDDPKIVLKGVVQEVA